MSIKAYVGRMGSGKTYEVVTSVILPALARGRRVISNIAGLDYDEFLAVLVYDGIPIDKIGQLVQVSHDDVLRPDFWLTDNDNVQERASAKNHCIIPGDLVALDEIWRFWDGFGGNKMPDRVINFIRMHRHFTHPDTGVACDVALISQDVMDISRKVRAVIEETYHMEKLTAVGSSKRYRVDVHQGGKTSRKPLRQLHRSYDPRYYSLYSSHSLKQEGASDAREDNIDSRGNILHSPIFRIGLPVAGVLMLISLWGVYRFFSPPTSIDNAANPAAASAADPMPPAADPTPSAAPPRPAIDDLWRVVGYWSNGSSISIMLQGASGQVRYIIDPPAFKLHILGLEVALPEGGYATSWTVVEQNKGVL